MQALCARLVDAGLSQVRVSVGERLSYPDEKITCGTARELSEQTFDKLSVALIENDHPDAIVTHGLRAAGRGVPAGRIGAHDQKRGAQRVSV